MEITTCINNFTCTRYVLFTRHVSGKEEDSYHIQNIMLQANYMADTINDFQDFIIPSKEKTVFNVHNTIKNMLKYSTT